MEGSQGSKPLSSHSNREVRVMAGREIYFDKEGFLWQIEHNSVLRPLYHLWQQGLITYDLVPFDGRGFVDPNDIAKAIKPHTKLVIVCHASNVLGTIQPIAEIGLLCAEKGVPLLVDAAQSAGVIPIDMAAWKIAAVALQRWKPWPKSTVLKIISAK